MSDRSGYRYNPIDPERGKRWPATPEVFADLAACAAEAAGLPEFAPDEHAVMAVPPIITEDRRVPQVSRVEKPGRLFGSPMSGAVRGMRAARL